MSQSANPGDPNEGDTEPTASSELAEIELADAVLADAEVVDVAALADLGSDPLDAIAGGGGLDFGAMMQMAQDMSERMGEAQNELAEARVEGSAGGGLVKVVLNGHLHLLEVDIDPAAIDPDDPSMLGDLIVAAWRDAQDEVAALQAAADPLGGLGGALGGGLGDLFGGS